MRENPYMTVSIIVSVYNEELVLNRFYTSIENIIKTLPFSFELIFVNDGSTDGSQRIIDCFLEKNSNVRSIEFTTNFGHEAAMIAGIDFAKGDVLICMDCDLQHPPYLIQDMLSLYVADQVDIINMVRKEEKIFNFSTLFYKLLNKLIPFEVEVNASDFFLITAKVADVLRKNYRERVRFLRGIIQMIGYKKAKIEFTAPERTEGESKYTITKLISLSITAIASLSRKPLKFSIYIGFASMLFSIALTIYSVLMKIIEKPVSGYTTIVVFMGIMFSIQFFILGIIGEYIGFLFEEQKDRPIYIVNKTSNIE
ncbi:MAG: glycosyltransferase family 2 protein [Paludibacteraceae bacterium]